MSEWKMEQLVERMARMESRLCQLMFHLGLDPAQRLYDEPRKTPLEVYAEQRSRDT